MAQDHTLSAFLSKLHILTTFVTGLDCSYFLISIKMASKLEDKTETLPISMPEKEEMEKRYQPKNKMVSK